MEEGEEEEVVRQGSLVCSELKGQLSAGFVNGDRRNSRFVPQQRNKQQAAGELQFEGQVTFARANPMTLKQFDLQDRNWPLQSPLRSQRFPEEAPGRRLGRARWPWRGWGRGLWNPTSLSVLC